MKNDARVRYTRMRIREAFYACLKEKPVSKITVKEICSMAEINRATFYKHYADPFDLMRQMEEEELEQLKQNIHACGDGSHQSILLTIMDNMNNTDTHCAILASENGDPNFAARIAEIFYQEYRPQVAQSLPGRTAREQYNAYLFLAGGCGALLNEWTRSGMKGSPEQVADEMRELSDALIRAYRQNDMSDRH